MSRITIDGEEFNIPHKSIRLDALFEIVGLDPLKDRLCLVSSTRRKVTEYCCLHDMVDISEGMCFISH